MRPYTLVCFFVLGTPLGNAAPPEVRMTIRHSAEAQTKPILRIPAKFVNGRGAASAPWTTSGNNVISGLLLSLAVVTGGYWLVRRRRPPAPGLATLALVALAAVTAVADIRLPGSKDNRPPPSRDILRFPIAEALQRPGELTGTVILQVTPVGDQVELLIPKPLEPRRRD